MASCYYFIKVVVLSVFSCPPNYVISITFFITLEYDELTETSRNILEALLRTLAKMPHHLSNVIKTKQLCVF